MATAAYKAGDESGRPSWALATRGYARLLHERLHDQMEALLAEISQKHARAKM